jgi:hypothetical protein
MEMPFAVTIGPRPGFAFPVMPPSLLVGVLTAALGFAPCCFVAEVLVRLPPRRAQQVILGVRVHHRRVRDDPGLFG